MNFTKVIKNPKAYISIGKQRLVNQWRTIIFRGDAVSCEICNWNGKQFFNGCCPNCNSLPRTRLIPYALRYFKLEDHSPKILHVAPNTNEFNYIKTHVTPLVNYDRLNIRPVTHINIVQDLTKTNLDSNSYDLAIAWHVLEHIPKDIEAIKEVYRLLKPHGYFLVSVPIFPIGNKTTYEDPLIPYSDFEKAHGHYDHCRSCGLDYYERFEHIGFKTETLVMKDIDSEDLKYYGLRDDHVVWCFKK